MLLRHQWPNRVCTQEAIPAVIWIPHGILHFVKPTRAPLRVLWHKTGSWIVCPMQVQANQAEALTLRLVQLSLATKTPLCHPSLVNPLRVPHDRICATAYHHAAPP